MRASRQTGDTSTDEMGPIFTKAWRAAAWRAAGRPWIFRECCSPRSRRYAGGFSRGRTERAPSTSPNVPTACSNRRS